MPNTEVAYLAGLMDGEGCIYMERKASRHSYSYVLVVRVTNEHKGALERCKEKFGGSLYTMSEADTEQNRKQIFQWSIKGKAAHEFLKTVVPFLVIKLEQAQLVIDNWEKIRPRGIGEPFRGDLEENRYQVWSGLRNLKRKKYE